MMDRKITCRSGLENVTTKYRSKLVFHHETRNGKNKTRETEPASGLVVLLTSDSGLICFQFSQSLLATLSLFGVEPLIGLASLMKLGFGYTID